MTTTHTQTSSSVSNPPESRLSHGLSRVEDVVYWASVAALIAMMIGISADAVGRYFFNSPLVGTREIVTRYLLIGTAWLAFARVQRLGGHVAIDFLMNKAPAQFQHVSGIITNIIGALVSVVFFIAAVERMVITFGLRSFGTIELPIWPAWAMIAIGSILFAIRLTIDCFRPRDAFVVTGTVEELVAEAVDADHTNERAGS